MADAKFLDRVLESFVSTGTGTINLDGPATGFRAFATALGGSGAVFYFMFGAAGGADANNWEFGYGTLTDASPDTLTRNLIKSNTGSLISWAAGTKYVMSTIVADVLMGWARPYRGTTRPGWLGQGGLWVDSTGGVTALLLKYFDGTDDITLGTINETANTFTPALAALLATANTFTAANTFQGLVDAQQDIRLSGDISPSQLTSNTDNWNPTGLSTASVIRFSTDASRNITGLAGGADGRAILLKNVGVQDAVLVHDATSTAGNRFYCPGSANFTLGANAACWLVYDATSSRWRVIGVAAASSATGASQAQQEAASSSVVFVTPAVQHFHPSALKYGGHITYSSGVPTLNSNYNMTGITDTATGRCGCTIGNDPSGSTAHWPVVANLGTETDKLIASVTSMAAGTFELRLWTSGGTLTDPGNGNGFTFLGGGDL